MVRSPFCSRRFAWCTFAVTTGVTASAWAQPLDGPGVLPTRVVHKFDFDERKAGNLEDIPKYWVPLRPKGFPHYAYGAFDFETGKSAPPSFHLTSEGRNVAYQYNGPETRVRENSDYRIVGFIRPDRLTHARACLSAHYLDKFGRPIFGTVVRSPYVDGKDGTDGWIGVELHLSAAPPEAHTVGLVAWVLQEPVWTNSRPARHHIPRNDVRGGAWFDDITIFALPRARITTGVPGNILVPGGPQELRVVLADNEPPTLEGRLTITGVDSALVATHPVPVLLDAGVEALRVAVDHLSPGLYSARLDVFGGGMAVVSKELTFAVVGRRLGGSKAAAKPFGVVVNPGERADPAVELALLQRQAVGSVKLPVWSGLDEAPPTLQERRATDRLLQELVKGGFSLTGVLVGPPSTIVRSEGEYVRPLIELLSGEPDVWREQLAAVVSPYAGTFHWWQLGRDPPTVRAAPDTDARRAIALAQFREAILPYVTAPRLAVPRRANVEPTGEEPPAQQVTLAVEKGVPPSRLAEQLRYFKKKAGYESVAAFVEPLPAKSYRRLPRLADWARRIITARHVGADTVFVPQTWRVRRTPDGSIAEPKELYVVLRTIADVLGNADPGPRVRIGRGVHALAFHHGTSTTLAMWDSHAPPEGRKYSIQLGRADRWIDLWGRSTPLKRDEKGRQIVCLTSVPVLIPGIERWLIDFRTSLSLRPEHVQSGTELVRHEVAMSYKGDHPVSGSLTFAVPDSWHIAPRTFSFNVMPQRVATYPVQVRYPHNEPAGEKQIIARMTLSSEPYYIEVPLPVEVDVTDLGVWGLAVVEGDELVLRQVVTNRSSETLNFRGSAVVPGRQRQYRPITGLQPGDTQAVEYRFAAAGDLIGRNARLVLREINDGPRVHTLELNIP